MISLYKNNHHLIKCQKVFKCAPDQQLFIVRHKQRFQVGTLAAMLDLVGGEYFGAALSEPDSVPVGLTEPGDDDGIAVFEELPFLSGAVFKRNWLGA